MLPFSSAGAAICHEFNSPVLGNQAVSFGGDINQGDIGTGDIKQLCHSLAKGGTSSANLSVSFALQMLQL